MAMCLDTTLGWDPVSRCALTAPHVSDSIARVDGESSVHVRPSSVAASSDSPPSACEGLPGPLALFLVQASAEEKQACSGVKGTPVLLH